MKSTRTVEMVVAAVVVVLAMPGQAAVSGPDEGSFFVTVEGGRSDWNKLNEDPAMSGGDGYRLPLAQLGSPWFSYPQAQALTDPWGNTENWPTFWNQWWYDGIYDPARWKLVDISFTYKRMNPADNGFAFIVVNWSTPGYGPNPEGPPLQDVGQDGTVYIGRAEITTLEITDDEIRTYAIIDYRLPIPYNPEWVSIDVRGYNFQLTGGVIIHECVPEPTTAALLIMASLFFLQRRR